MKSQLGKEEHSGYQIIKRKKARKLVGMDVVDEDQTMSRKEQASLMVVLPIRPIDFTSNTRHGVDPGVDINLEVGSTHHPFTVYSGHCLHLVHWMLEAHQPSIAVEHAP